MCPAFVEGSFQRPQHLMLYFLWKIMYGDRRSRGVNISSLTESKLGSRLGRTWSFRRAWSWCSCRGVCAPAPEANTQQRFGISYIADIPWHRTSPGEGFPSEQTGRCCSARTSDEELVWSHHVAAGTLCGRSARACRTLKRFPVFLWRKRPRESWACGSLELDSVNIISITPWEDSMMLLTHKDGFLPGRRPKIASLLRNRSQRMVALKAVIMFTKHLQLKRTANLLKCQIVRALSKAYSSKEAWSSQNGTHIFVHCLILYGMRDLNCVRQKISKAFNPPFYIQAIHTQKWSFMNFTRDNVHLLCETRWPHDLWETRCSAVCHGRSGSLQIVKGHSITLALYACCDVI